MVEFGGTYQFVKCENWEEYLTAFGLPTENLKKAVEDKSNLVIAYDGSKFQVDFGAHSFEWQVNKEILEHREDTDVTVKTVLDGNTLTVYSKSSKDGMTWERVLKFSDEGVVVTHTCSKTGDIVATRQYKRI